MYLIFIQSFFVFLLGNCGSVCASQPANIEDSAANHCTQSKRQLLDIEQHEQIKSSLSSSPIFKEIAQLKEKRGRKKYLVELQDRTVALFKEREYKKLSGIFPEIMSYKIAHFLLGLNHTVPPIVVKKYRGLFGTLQFYIDSDLSIDDHLVKCVKDANHDSYNNLQIFLFCCSMGDLNREGIIPWYQGEKINFSYIDSEMAFFYPTGYGKLSPEFTNTLTNYDNIKHVFTSRYTVSYSDQILEKLKAMTYEKINEIYESTLVEMDSVLGKEFTMNSAYRDMNTKKETINNIVKNAKVILAAASEIIK